MDITRTTPTVADLDDALAALRAWQVDDAPFQLHPGDIGWFGRLGADRAAAAVRVWRGDGRVLAVGLTDGDDLLRLGLAPDAQRDAELAEQVTADLIDPERGVLGRGAVAVETPVGALVHDLLGERGWGLDEPWTLLRRDLTDPVEEPGVAIEAVGPDTAAEWSAVQRAAFGVPQDITDRWHAMAAGPAYADGRSLLARDADGVPAAGVIVWAAGRGRCGILEPMGVHPEHRGHGHGRAITLAAAAALRDLGASAAVVATPASNTGAVATYLSAGFATLPERRDRCRPAR